MSVRVGARRLSFWAAVGGVSLVSLFALKVAANKVPIPSLKQFSDFITSSGGA